jgi:hypothetical protein
MMAVRGLGSPGSGLDTLEEDVRAFWAEREQSCPLLAMMMMTMVLIAPRLMIWGLDSRALPVVVAAVAVLGSHASRML